MPPDYATVNTRSYTGMIRGDYPPGFLKAARDRQVVLVDDICDSGETLYHLKTTLTPLAAHVWTCAMLDKSAARQVPVFLDFCGMALDGTPFVYGFGLDIDGAHRGLNQIGIKQ